MAGNQLSVLEGRLAHASVRYWPGRQLKSGLAPGNFLLGAKSSERVKKIFYRWGSLKPEGTYHAARFGSTS